MINVLPKPLKEYLNFLIELVSGRRLKHEYEFSNTRDKDLSEFNAPEFIECLDVGNGFIRPQYYILLSQGKNLTGVDFINNPPPGIKSAFQTLARWIYLLSLYINNGLFNTSRGRLFNCNVEKMPFKDSSFDLITSIAAFEHFLNIDAVFTETARVLKPGGYIWIAIHIFTSPSGAHNVTFTEVPLMNMPEHIEPWDHLRKKIVPIKVPLNKLRIQDYLSFFEKHFSLLKNYCYLKEGEHFLTPEIKAELTPMYDEDELTCATYVIVGRSKKAVQASNQ